MPQYETLVTLPDPTFHQLCEQITADMDRLSIPGVAVGVLAGDQGVAAGFGVTVDCRVGCGACCIAPSISSPIPGMPDGKPAGVRCVQLTADNRCKLFGQPDRPAVCIGLRPSEEMCGHTAEQALAWLSELELATHPKLGRFPEL